MLTEKEIDKLMQRIQAGETVYIYYIAHGIEGRERWLDEHQYKSLSRFKVVRVELTDIQNAYPEWVYYRSHPDEYHVEEEIEYHRKETTYYHYYMTKNTSGPYNLDINPRMPSIIYGRTKRVYVDNELVQETHERSPVMQRYTNFPKYGDLYGTELSQALESGKMDWKYTKLAAPADVDGIMYNYAYSNWYILTLRNYPSIEKPLICAGERSSYFVDLEDAFFYIDQLIA
jgi:hypothetical protein